VDREATDDSGKKRGFREKVVEKMPGDYYRFLNVDDPDLKIILIRRGNILMRSVGMYNDTQTFRRADLYALHLVRQRVGGWPNGKEFGEENMVELPFPIFIRLVKLGNGYRVGRPVNIYNNIRDIRLGEGKRFVPDGGAACAKYQIRTPSQVYRTPPP
jgi:hypothetical protein